TIKSQIQFHIPTITEYTIDADGDINVSRAQLINLTIIHRELTTVNECGFQLWNGCLLLCDYLLNKPELFENKTILELGAGIGLTSIIVSRFAELVYCTDYNIELLQIAQQNIENNLYEIDNKVQIRCLDWLKHSHCLPCTSDLFNWTDKDIVQLNDLEIILAADVIYDDQLTDEFFNVLENFILNYKNVHSIYIAMEKRINFYVETLSAGCPQYDYLIQKLEMLNKTLTKNAIEHNIYQINVENILQCTPYERTKELILWEIKIKRQ
ncbi:unnamed protein product, partial [Didymodactylos carnosus]